MSDEQGSPRFSRRHWGREVLELWVGATGWLRNKDGKISRIAVLAYIMLYFFLRNWPTAWDKWAYMAFATPGALLVLNAVAEKVPLADMLDAMRAGSTEKIVSRLRGIVSEPVAVITETEGGKTTTTVPGRVGDGTDPVPPQGAEASGQERDQGEGDV